MKSTVQASREDQRGGGALRWADTEQAETIIEAHRTLDGPMLPILHALQESFGYVPVEAEPLIASALNISRAEVHGVISFYHDFRRERAGAHVLKLCRAEACQAMGGARLAKRMLARLGLDWGGKTADGALTVEPTFCVGLCARAPAALLDGQPLVRITEESLDAALTEAGR